MSYYHDKYKWHQSNQGNIDHEGQQHAIRQPLPDLSPVEERKSTGASTSNISNDRAGGQSHSTLVSFRGADWNHHGGAYGSTVGGDYRSFYENASTPNEDCRFAAPMPSLPTAGMARSPYFQPNEVPQTSHRIVSKITPSDSFNTNDHRNSVYQESSYYAAAPAISPLIGLSASGSSESSTASTRPAPARSAFMMFSEAKRGEIMRRVGSSVRTGHRFV